MGASGVAIKGQPQGQTVYSGAQPATGGTPDIPILTDATGVLITRNDMALNNSGGLQNEIFATISGAGANTLAALMAASAGGNTLIGAVSGTVQMQAVGADVYVGALLVTAASGVGVKYANGTIFYYPATVAAGLSLYFSAACKFYALQQS